MSPKETSRKKIGKASIPAPMYPEHGGNPARMAQLAGVGPGEIIDFSANINPLGPPPDVQSTLSHTDYEIRNYPDPEYPALKNRLSRFLGVDTGRIVVTNGSTELIHYLPRLWGGNRELALVCPCFSEYERSFTLADVCIRKIFLRPENNFQPEIEPLLFQLTGWKNLGGIVIGHPNSPAGCLMSSESLRALLNYCEKRELFLVVDETFIEFCDPESSMLRHMRQSRFLVLVRSFTKFFALPGLRLGYGIMHEAQAEKLQKCLPPWSVNSVAEAAGLAALDAGDFIESSREGVRVERIALHQNLESLEELEVFPSDANFILFRLKSGDESRADRLYTDLLSEGILMRNCGNFDGLNRSYFRVAVRSQTDNTRLIDALQRHLY